MNLSDGLNSSDGLNLPDGVNSPDEVNSELSNDTIDKQNSNSLESLENLDDVKKKTINSANPGQPIQKSYNRKKISEAQWKLYKEEKMLIVDLRKIRDEKWCTEEEFEEYETIRKPIENEVSRSIEHDKRKWLNEIGGLFSRDYIQYINRYPWRQILTWYKLGYVTYDEYNLYMNTKEQVLKEKAERGEPLDYDEHCERAMSKEELIKRNLIPEEKTPPQSFYQSYLQGNIKPWDLRLIHRRNILEYNDRQKLDKLFQEWYKKGWCTEEERTFLWTNPNTGKWIYRPDVHDWSVKCPFKDCEKKWGWEQCKNPESM